LERRLWLHDVPSVAVSSPGSDGRTLKGRDAGQFNRVFRYDKDFPDSSAKPGNKILSGLSPRTVVGKIELGKIVIKRSPKFIVQVNERRRRLVLQINPRRDGCDEIILFVPFGQEEVVVILLFNIHARNEGPLRVNESRREYWKQGYSND